MTDVSTPFANGVPELRRLPTAEEKVAGFMCGPADLALFNGLIHMLYSEMKTLATAAGVSGSDADYATIRDSVNALIAAATGGGDTAQFVLYDQARARLPIHFEVLSADGKINVTSPAAGTVRVPGGVGFIHRGIFQTTSAQTDFSTSSSKTYHVRWNPADGFTLKDLADTGYNPSALPETDTAFDGAYDDALIARVTTSASNIATITNLVNKARLASVQVQAGFNGRKLGENESNFDFNFGLDWSRRPDWWSFSTFSRGTSNSSGGTPETTDYDFVTRAYGGTAGVGFRPVDRYRSRFALLADQTTAISLEASFGA